MAIKYEPYFPQTIEGQAILNNFTRTQRMLKYNDNGSVFTSIAKGMPLYEMESVEKVGLNKDNNLVIRGECLSTCAYLKNKNIKVDLVYIDPPFASGADYAKKVYIRRNPKIAEAIKKAEEELDNSDLKAFEEKMYGDIWNKEAYLNWMYENLMAIKSVMSETASIYVHLDWHIGHYVKILMDEIFGESNFINEIIWQYYMGGKGKNEFAKKHDNIYLYSNSKGNHIFNKLDIKRYYDFKPSLIDESENASSGKDDIGYYGIIACPDVWSIRGVFNMGSEYLNYGTQKPEALLERIIKASSNEGMVVGDFFGGSGVTAAVASKLKRKFITCDVGLNSIQTIRDRLVADKAQFEILDVKDGISLYRNPQQTMDKIKSLINGLRNEDGLSKFWEGAIQDSKLGLVPVYVPNLIEGSGRILDTKLANEIIHLALPDLSDKNIKQVIVYYIDIENEKEISDFINQHNDTEIKIELRDLKELLSEVVVNDEVVYKVLESEIEIQTFMSDRVKIKIDEYNQKMKAQKEKKGHAYEPLLISEDGLEMIEFISLDCTNKEGSWQSDSEIKVEKNNLVTINGTKTKEFWNGKIKFDKKPLRMKIRNICGDESILSL